MNRFLKQTSITKQQVDRTSNTIKVVAVLTAVGWGLNFSRFNSQANPVGFGLLCAGFAVELATSALTSISCSTCGLDQEYYQRKLEEENKMTWGQFLPHLGIKLVNPCGNLRRFFAGGSLLTDLFAIPAQAMLISEYSTLISMLMPPYALAKAVSLALPTRDDVALLTFGLLKTAFSVVALGLASVEKENKAIIIASEALFLASGVLSIASGIKTFTEVRANSGFERV